MTWKLSLTGLVLALNLSISAPFAARAQNADALVTFHAMKPEIALELAQAALTLCRDAGYQVAVAIADRAGTPQVVLRDQYAGAHTVDTALRKAWTAVSFRTATLELSDAIVDNKVMAHLPNVTQALPLGGGVPVLAGGTLVGGVGISGAPGPDIDHDCAVKAIETIQDKLDF